MPQTPGSDRSFGIAEIDLVPPAWKAGLTQTKSDTMKSIYPGSGIFGDNRKLR
jgi:hypothetical protein